MQTACTQVSHEQLKLNPIAWQLETEPPGGHATRPVIDAGDLWLEYANCRHCHSTIARQVEIRLEARP